MLRCVIGRVKPKGGFVRVFGYKPNEAGSQIPGAAIGYMPQVSCYLLLLLLRSIVFLQPSSIFLTLTLTLYKTTQKLTKPQSKQFQQTNQNAQQTNNNRNKTK